MTNWHSSTCILQFLIVSQQEVAKKKVDLVDLEKAGLRCFNWITATVSYL